MVVENLQHLDVLELCFKVGSLIFYTFGYLLNVMLEFIFLIIPFILILKILFFYESCNTVLDKKRGKIEKKKLIWTNDLKRQVN